MGIEEQHMKNEKQKNIEKKRRKQAMAEAIKDRTTIRNKTRQDGNLFQLLLLINYFGEEKRHKEEEWIDGKHNLILWIIFSMLLLSRLAHALKLEGILSCFDKIKKLPLYMFCFFSICFFFICG